MPTVTLCDADLTDNSLDILTLLLKAGLLASKSEARRAVEQGGVTVNEQKITDIKAVFSADALREGLLVRRGKKAYKKVILG